jgi:hypothetical protein
VYTAKSPLANTDCDDRSELLVRKQPAKRHRSSAGSYEPSYAASSVRGRDLVERVPQVRLLHSTFSRPLASQWKRGDAVVSWSSLGTIAVSGVLRGVGRCCQRWAGPRPMLSWTTATSLSGGIPPIQERQNPIFISGTKAESLCPVQFRSRLSIESWEHFSVQPVQAPTEGPILIPWMRCNLSLFLNPHPFGL